MKKSPAFWQGIFYGVGGIDCKKAAVRHIGRVIGMKAPGGFMMLPGLLKVPHGVIAHTQLHMRDIS